MVCGLGFSKRPPSPANEQSETPKKSRCSEPGKIMKPKPKQRTSRSGVIKIKEQKPELIEEKKIEVKKVKEKKVEEKEAPEEEPFACLIVVDPSVTVTKVVDSVKWMQCFEPEVPIFCSEARRAEKNGSFLVKALPGIPRKKFNASDYKTANIADQDWPIQAVYDMVTVSKPTKTKDQKRTSELNYEISTKEEVCQDQFLLYYEGWTCNYINPESVDNVPPFPLSMLKFRRDFIRARREMARAELSRMIKYQKKIGEPMSEKDAEEEFGRIFCETRAQDVLRYPGSVFWLLEDLTYIHSVHNDQYNLGPIFYMALVELSKVKPPEYAFTALNIVQKDVYDKLLARDSNRTFNQLFKHSVYVHRQSPGAVCSGKNCVCYLLFVKLYQDAGMNVQYLTYKKDGRIDFKEFQAQFPRVVVECSDACKCGEECPRRRLQRGQTGPLVVSFERNVGYGVRAASRIEAGDLICEYTGDVLFVDNSVKFEHTIGEKLLPLRRELNSPGGTRNNIRMSDAEAENKENADVEEGKKKDTSYEVGMAVICTDVVICALNRGNIARFINHSCNPNTVFVEVHSRRLESQPLIPRIGVYAIKDIPLGEQITVSYWTDEERRTAKRSGTMCRCGEKNCQEFLPEQV